MLHTLPPGPVPRKGAHGLEPAVYLLRHEGGDIHALVSEYRRQKYLPHSTSPAAAALVLGMGMVGGLEAARNLLSIYSTAKRQLAWATADALIALDSPGEADCKRCQNATNKKQAELTEVRQLVVGTLIDGYPSATEADKRRGLYVLAFLRAREARALAEAASHSHDSQIVGWAIRLLSLIGTSDSDIQDWLTRLSAVAAGNGKGPWRDEWTQKRLVRALDDAPLNPAQRAQAYQEVQRLAERLAKETTIKAPTSKRRALVVAVKKFRGTAGPTPAVSTPTGATST